jgi:hypothetical protein
MAEDLRRMPTMLPFTIRTTRSAVVAVAPAITTVVCSDDATGSR